VDFWSDDRARGVDDRAMTTERWSTPVSAYGTFGPFHLMRTGEGRWHLATGEFAYIQLTLDDVRYNVGPE
jgi:hypothetical protein